MFSEGKKVLGPNLKQNSTECHTQLLTIIIIIIIHHRNVGHNHTQS
jgi:hypothetical protein